MNQLWYLYMVRCRNNSLYTGITTDVKRRFTEHTVQKNKCAKYLRGKAPLVLVYVDLVGSYSVALTLERYVKRLSKSAKEKLIAVNKF